MSKLRSKKLCLIIFVLSMFSIGIAHAKEQERFPSGAAAGEKFTMRYGVDFLLGFLPMPLLEGNVKINKMHLRATIASSLVWGRFTGGLAYDLTDSKKTALYADAGVFYAGIVYGHLFEGGIEFHDVSLLRSDLRLGVAALNTDSVDPWNGRQLDSTRIFPRIGIVRDF